jgi:hypothetical protein
LFRKRDWNMRKVPVCIFHCLYVSIYKPKLLLQLISNKQL